MNNSKKINPKKGKEIKKSEKPITSIPLPWLIVSIVLIVSLVGGVLFDQLYEPTLITIDGKKYQMSDLAYYFYTVESSYDYYDKMMNGQYWDMAYNEKKKTTMRDKAKEDALKSILQYEMLYNDAVKKNYKLTSKEEKTVKSNVQQFLSSTQSASVIQKNHFTTAYLTKILNKVTLAQDYRNDIIDSLNVDDAAIKAKVKYNDYRQYDIEYIMVSTQTTDSSGKAADISDAKKKDAYNKISAIYDKAKASKDWSKLLPKDQTDLSYQTGNFIKNDNTFSEAFEAMMMKMNNNDVSTIYEDKTGYYIVRMKNNNSSERYNSEVKQKISEAEDSAFETYFTKNIKPKHTYKYNKKELNKLTMGYITLDNSTTNLSTSTNTSE